MSISPISHGPTRGPDALVAQVAAQRETLNYRSMDLQLDLTDNRGRAVSLSLGLEQLDYSRTYTRAGVVMGPGGDRSAGPGTQARVGTGREVGLQALYERQELSYTGFQLEVSGDVDLLQDYFSVEGTAQRIFDFVSGLAGDGASSAVTDQIMAGVEEGFAQAEAILGDLPQVSRDTQTVLTAMLERFRDEGDRDLHAADFLSLLAADGADGDAD